MATQLERRTTTRQSIVSAALRCYLAADGIQVSLDTIAVDAGVAKATILYHFDNRIGLLGAVADHLLGEFLERLGPLERFATLEEGVRAYLEQGLEPTASLFTQVSDALTYAGQIGIGIAQGRLVEVLRDMGITKSPTVVAAALQTMMRQIAFGYVSSSGIDEFMVELSHVM